MTTVHLDSVRIVPLPDSTYLADFECGKSEIDRRVAGCCEGHADYRSRTTCAIVENDPLAFGFYTLGIHVHSSKHLMALLNLGERRDWIAFLYLHCLAVRRHLQKQGIGTLLLGHCLRRCAQMVSEIGGVHGVALNALTTEVADMYDGFGFREFGKRGKYPFMVLPAKSLLDLKKIQI